MRRSSRGRFALLLGLSFASLYAAISRGIFTFGDDILMFQVSEAIVERGSVAVDSPHDRGDVARAIRGRDGRGYSKYGLGLSLVALPAYALSEPVFRRHFGLYEGFDRFGNERTGARVYGTGLTNAAIGGATIAVFFLVALECAYAVPVAFLLSLLLGTGTLLVHYSATFLSEPLSAFCLSLAFLGLVRARKELNQDPRQSSSIWLFLAGLAMGYAVMTRAANLVVVAPLIGWALLMLSGVWRRGRPAALRLAAAWILPFAACLAVVVTYNWTRFGSALETGYGEEAGMFSTPILEGISGLLLSPGRSLFLYSPPLVLSLFGFVRFRRRDPAAAWVILSVSALTLLLHSRYYLWHGGGCWGPRFLVPILPLALLPAGEVLERARTGARLPRIGAAAAALAGLALTALVVVVPYDPYIDEIEHSPEKFAASLWTWSASSIAVHAKSLPTTLRAAGGRNVAGDRVRTGPGEERADWRRSAPDVAAVLYRSRNLRRLTLLWFAYGVAGLAVLANWTPRLREEK